MEEEKRILVIDDDPSFLKCVSEYLNGHYAVSVAKSGKAALRLLGQGSCPDLILLDIEMPGMDGYEVMKCLKDDPQTKRIPVVYLTGLHQEEYETKGIDSGALDFLRKPVSSQVLLVRIHNYLEIARALRSEGRGELDEERLDGLPRPLSSRELETARLMARFYTNEQIAGELNVTVSRVKQLVAGVLDKLEIEKRSDIRKYFK